MGEYPYALPHSFYEGMRWKVSRLFPNYQILSTKSCSSVPQTFYVLKLPAQFLYTRNLERRAEFLLQNVENGGCHQIFALFRGTCRFENLQKTLLDRGNLLKLSVMLHDDGGFLGVADCGSHRRRQAQPDHQERIRNIRILIDS